jgi:integrase
MLSETGAIGPATAVAGPMCEWAAAIATWLAVLRAAGRPATTVGLREYQLRRLAAAMVPGGPWAVTESQLVAWIGGHGWAPSTLRSYRSALRSFYRWGHAHGYIAVDPALGLPAVKPASPNPRPAPEDAYRLALARADERVRLMLRLAAELGLRRGEVARAHTDDLELDLTGWTLRVVGKGGKVRRLPLSDALAAAIRRSDQGYLFPGDVDGHLSARWVGRLVSRALPGAWAMHSLRHRFATAAYSLDRDMFTVQELLGHASPVTTRMYVRLPDDAMRRTVLAVSRL